LLIFELILVWSQTGTKCIQTQKMHRPKQPVYPLLITDSLFFKFLHFIYKLLKANQKLLPIQTYKTYHFDNSILQKLLIHTTMWEDTQVYLYIYLNLKLDRFIF
jgi:hypothetical protein